MTNNDKVRLILNPDALADLRRELASAAIAVDEIERVQRRCEAVPVAEVQALNDRLVLLARTCAQAPKSLSFALTLTNRKA